MKKLVLLSILALQFSLFNTTKGQTWKQFADSAALVSSDTATKQKAIDYYSRSLALLANDSANTSTFASINDSLAKLYIELQKYKEAEEPYLKSQQVREELFGKHSLEYALSCHNLGYLYGYFLDNYPKSKILLQTAMAIREIRLGTKNESYALSCFYLANAFLKSGESDGALALYLKVKDIRTELLGPSHPETVKAIANIGNIYSNKGDILKALSYYLQARQLFEQSVGKEHPFYLQITMNVADKYSDLSQGTKAVQLYTENQKKIDKLYGRKSMLSQNNISLLGEAYLEMGNFEMAEIMFQERRNLLEETLGKESNLYGANSLNLGLMFYRMGQYKKAEEYLQASKRIREKVIGKNNQQYADCCSFLADLYTQTKQYQKAEDLFLEGLKIRMALEGKSHNYATDCYKLGNLYRHTGAYEKAKAVLIDGKRALQTASLKNLFQYRELCVALGLVYFATGNFKEAKQQYQEGLQVSAENTLVGEDQAKATIYRHLAEVDWKQKNFASAYALFTKALTLQNNRLQQIFRFTGESEKQAYLNTVSNFTNSFYSFALKHHPIARQGIAYNLSSANRYLILSSAQQLSKIVYSTNGTTARNDYETWLSVKNELGKWYTQPKNRRPDSLSAMEEKATNLEKRLTRTISALAQNKTKSGDWKNIQQLLKPDEAAVEFVEFRYYDVQRVTDSIYYIALILRKNMSEPVLVLLGEKQRLTSILSSTDTKAQGMADLYAHGNSALYNMIWQPLERSLQGVRTVYFAPDGLLHTIAFPALPVNSYRLLSDKYRLVQLNNTASIQERLTFTVSTSDTIILYGGIKYSAEATLPGIDASPAISVSSSQRSLPPELTRSNVWQELPGTRVEVTGIKAAGPQYAVTVVSGTDATEQSVKALNGGTSPAVLHLATHGFFFPDPKMVSANQFETRGRVFKQSDNPLFRSGLLFAGANQSWQGKASTGVDDGILTAYEVSNLYLPNTKLVVISACETALGDIQGSEGVYGLQRAFKMAGVQNLVMSLWKVPDAETAEFMQEFYKHLFNKTSISDSFYKAQTAMKNKYRDEPYKWAAWVLVR